MTGNLIVDKIAVVLVNYYSQEFISTCLNSLNALKRTDLTYIIVDNSEEPQSDYILHENPDVIYLQSGSNLRRAR